MTKKFRRVFFATLVLALFISKQGFSQPAPPDGMIWENVETLTDEFDRWDGNKWTKSLWNYGVPVQMVSRNSGVIDGNLIIKATLNSGEERWFETSRVMSKTRISYPMYTECSMKTAHISAYNTFWLNNGNSTSRDEIDVCENNSKASIESQREERKYTMMSQYFVVVDNNTERDKGNFDNRNLSADNPLKGVPWNEAYHTLGVWWKDANNIQFYLDGEPAGKVKSTRDFTRSLNIIWDLWTIDASWSGGIAVKEDLQNSDINTMYVDWIHTYKLKEDPSAGVRIKKKDESLKIYPNPANDVINIEIDDDMSFAAKLKVYDSIGRLVLSDVLQNGLTEMSLRALSKGIYYVNITAENKTFSKMIIKG